jgi:hypothetical protein
MGINATRMPVHAHPLGCIQLPDFEVKISDWKEFPSGASRKTEKYFG